MKRRGGLWPEVVSFENLLGARSICDAKALQGHESGFAAAGLEWFSSCVDIFDGWQLRCDFSGKKVKKVLDPRENCGTLPDSTLEGPRKRGLERAETPGAAELSRKRSRPAVAVREATLRRSRPNQYCRSMRPVR